MGHFKMGQDDQGEPAAPMSIPSPFLIRPLNGHIEPYLNSETLIEYKRGTFVLFRSNFSGFCSFYYWVWVLVHPMPLAESSTSAHSPSLWCSRGAYISFPAFNCNEFMSQDLHSWMHTQSLQRFEKITLVKYLQGLKPHSVDVSFLA
jgi:hypothetical protein